MSQSRRIRRAQSRPIYFASAEELHTHLASVPPAAHHLEVQHGPHCSAIACRCSPTYVLRPATPEALQAGERAQAKWARESMS